MTNEIKEILDYLGNDKNYNCDCNDGSYYLELPYREAHELKDCITTLQKENEKIKKMNLSEHKYASDMEGKYIIEKAKEDEAIEFIDQVLQYDLSTNNKKKIDEDINTLIGILAGSDKQ